MRDGPEHDAVCVARRLDHGGRAGGTVAREAGEPDLMLLEGEAKPEQRVGTPQHREGRTHDLRSDPVTGQHNQSHDHLLPRPEGCRSATRRATRGG